VAATGNRRTADEYFDVKERIAEAATKEEEKPKPTFNEFTIEEPVAAAPAVVRTLEDSEAEYQALMHGPNAPSWAAAANNDAARPAADVELDGTVEPALVETTEAYQASVAELNAAHEKAVTELGEAHRRRLSQMMAARRNQEVEEAKSNEKGLAGNLAAVLKSMQEAEEERGGTAAEVAALNDKESEAAILAALRARLKPSLDAADAIAAQLHLWASQFKAPFEKQKEKNRGEWLDQMPSSTSQEVASSAAMAHQIEKLLNDVLSLYDNALSTQRENRRAIESLVTTGRLRLDHYEFERSLTQHLHELRMSDVADSLNNYSRGIIDLLGRIQAKKNSTRGTTQPTIEFQNMSQVSDRAIQADAMMKDGSGPDMRTRIVTGPDSALSGRG
jgi:hypothetical protein